MGARAFPRESPSRSPPAADGISPPRPRPHPRDSSRNACAPRRMEKRLNGRRAARSRSAAPLLRRRRGRCRFRTRPSRFPRGWRAAASAAEPSPSSARPRPPRPRPPRPRHPRRLRVRPARGFGGTARGRTNPRRRCASREEIRTRRRGYSRVWGYARRRDASSRYACRTETKRRIASGRMTVAMTVAVAMAVTVAVAMAVTMAVRQRERRSRRSSRRSRRSSRRSRRRGDGGGGRRGADPRVARDSRTRRSNLRDVLRRVARACIARARRTRADDGRERRRVVVRRSIRRLLRRRIRLCRGRAVHAKRVGRRRGDVRGRAGARRVPATRDFAPPFGGDAALGSDSARASRIRVLSPPPRNAWLCWRRPRRRIRVLVVRVGAWRRSARDLPRRWSARTWTRRSGVRRFGWRARGV